MVPAVQGLSGRTFSRDRGEETAHEAPRHGEPLPTGRASPAEVAGTPETAPLKAQAGPRPSQTRGGSAGKASEFSRTKTLGESSRPPATSLPRKQWSPSCVAVPALGRPFQLWCSPRTALYPSAHSWSGRWVRVAGEALPGRRAGDNAGRWAVARDLQARRSGEGPKIRVPGPRRVPPGPPL